MTEINEHMGMRMRLARIGRGMKMAELARQSGVPVATLSRVERSRREMRVGDLVAVCIVLHLSPIELICGGEQWNPLKVSL